MCTVGPSSDTIFLKIFSSDPYVQRCWEPLIKREGKSSADEFVKRQGAWWIQNVVVGRTVKLEGDQPWKVKRGVNKNTACLHMGVQSEEFGRKWEVRDE